MGWLHGDASLFPLTDMEHYRERPDVIFVCVKGYSLAGTIPFIKKAAKKDTVVIPVLNIYGTGAKMQKELPELLITDGCIDVSANIKEPGVLLQHGKILRVVFGTRDKEDFREVLREIAEDLCDSGIEGVLSENIRRDARWKNFPMSPRSEQRACILTRWPGIFSGKENPGKLSKR